MDCSHTKKALSSHDKIKNDRVYQLSDLNFFHPRKRERKLPWYNNMARDTGSFLTFFSPIGDTLL